MNVTKYPEQWAITGPISAVYSFDVKYLVQGTKEFETV